MSLAHAMNAHQRNVPMSRERAAFEHFIMSQGDAARRDREYSKELENIYHGYMLALNLVADGKFSPQTLTDLIGQFATKLYEVLPSKEHDRLEKTGELEDLERLAREHDGTRDDYGVNQDRNAAERKLAETLLDSAYLDDRIDSETYVRLNREGRLSHSDDEELNNRAADGEDVAADLWAKRAMPDEPKKTGLTQWLEDRYGKGAGEGKGDGKGKKSGAPGHVEREKVVDIMPWDDGLDDEGKDENGIIDLDALDAREARARADKA